MQTYNEGMLLLHAVNFSGQITFPYKNVTLSGDFSFQYSISGTCYYVSANPTDLGLSWGL